MIPLLSVDLRKQWSERVYASVTVVVVHVRMSRIGNTSYTFQFLLQQKRTREVVSPGSLTLAWLDEEFKPMRIPDAFRETVKGFEGDKLEDTSSASE